MAIGSCDCCERMNVPISRIEPDRTSAQCETYACFICQGEDDVDPYGELEGSPAWERDNGQFGVGA